MFGMGGVEMLVVGIVALIVVGPKDLPGLFRTVGQFVGKAKGMAREFSSAMNAAADEAGVSEINKTIKAAANPQKFGVDKIREATKSSVQAGGETEALKSTLSAERAANKAKIDKAMAETANKRIAAEKGDAAPKTAPKTAKAKTSKAPAAKKTAAAKAAPKKAAPKKAAPKKTTAKSTAKPAAKKTTTKPKTKAAKDTK